MGKFTREGEKDLGPGAVNCCLVGATRDSKRHQDCTMQKKSYLGCFG